MENFTKGPWLWGGANVVLESDGMPLCCLVNSSVNTGDNTEDYANAALIAAAPEMYDELIDAVAGFEFIIGNSLVNAIYLPAIHQQIESINSILAKARGEK